MRYAHIETEESRQAHANAVLKSERFLNTNLTVRATIEKEILARPLGVVINLIEATPEFVASQPGLFIAMLEDIHPAEIGGAYDAKRDIFKPSPR